MPKARKAASPAQPGDEVIVRCESEEHLGVLLPSSEKDEGFVTLKLATGYNIGIRKARIASVELVEKGSASLLGNRKADNEKIKVAKPYISLVGCGGTIVNKIDYRTGAVYPTTSPKELIESLPALAKFRIKPQTLFSIASEDMAPAHWQKIAEAVSDELKDGANGVVLTHGTDLMHYTSSALSFMLQDLPCPVVLTGSQRSSDRGSSDAEVNIHSAMVAANADISGVFVCMHENMSDDSCLLHFGTKVRKMHTSRRDAFRSINTFPAARVFAASEKIEKLSERCPSRKPGGKFRVDAKLNTNVALRYAYPGMDPKEISSLSKYDGVVLVGFGLGHLPVNLAGNPDSIPLLSSVRSLIDSGIPVVMPSQTIYGRVDMNVYTNQRALLEAGIIGNLCDMTPETAYVKLMWVLAREKKMAKVKELMERSLVGEITERSEMAGY